MAVVTARTLRWYSPPRVARAMRQARRYPLVPLALLTVPAAVGLGGPELARSPAEGSDVRVVVYNSPDDMSAAMQRRSDTFHGSILTLGQRVSCCRWSMV